MGQVGPGSRNRRYLNTVRSVAIVPFQNVGSGAMYARICNNLNIYACSFLAMGDAESDEKVQSVQKAKMNRQLEEQTRRDP